MSDIRARLYSPGDLAACLAIFDSNVPNFFAPEERLEFREFLTNLDYCAGPYLVLEADSEVVACGGVFAHAENQTGSLAWGMVDQARHGQGLGTQLTEARLDLARSLPSIRELMLATSQHTRGFYEKFGFIVTSITPDGFGVGLDRVDMALQLA